MVRTFGLTDAVGNTYGFPRVIVYGPDGKIKFPSGGGGGSGTVTSIDVNGGTGISVSPAGPITTSGTFTVTNTAPDQIVSLSTTGTGLSVTGTYPTFTLQNTLPDQAVVLTAGTGIGITGTYPSFTISNSSPDQTVSLATTGTGLSVTGTYPSFTLQNTLPDQTVVLSAGTGISISGTYPSFTISASGSSGMPYGIASGTNNYTVTIAGVTGYVDGDAYIIKFTNGNDADSDININGLGVKTLVKEFNVQLTGGDIVSGQDLIIIYDGTNFQTIGVAPNQLFAYVTNDDSVTITKGQPVYAFGAAGNRMSVKLANNTSDATSAQTVGVVFSTSIAPNQRGFVICQGVISGVNTAAYSPGDQLYLGATAGALTNVKPYAPNHLVYVGIVERANAGNGQIYVKPQNGYEMNELHDVQSNGAVNKDVLYRDTTVTPNLWKPASIATILGYTPVNNSTLRCFSGASFSPADNTTYYFNQNINPTTNANNHKISFGFPVTITGALITSANAATVGTAENNTIRFRNVTTSTSTTLTTTLKTNAGTAAVNYANVTGLNVSVAATDEFCIEWVTPIWVTNPVNPLLQVFLFFNT